MERERRLGGKAYRLSAGGLTNTAEVECRWHVARRTARLSSLQPTEQFARLSSLQPTEQFAVPVEERCVAGGGALQSGCSISRCHVWGSQVVVNGNGDNQALRGCDNCLAGVPDGFTPRFPVRGLSRTSERSLIVSSDLQEGAKSDNITLCVKVGCDISLEPEGGSDLCSATGDSDAGLVENGERSGTDIDLSGVTIDESEDTVETHVRSDSDGVRSVIISASVELQTLVRQQLGHEAEAGSESRQSQQEGMSTAEGDDSWSDRLCIMKGCARLFAATANGKRGWSATANGERGWSTTANGERGWLNISTAVGQVDDEFQFEVVLNVSTAVGQVDDESQFEVALRANASEVGLDDLETSNVADVSCSDRDSSSDVDEQPGQEEPEADSATQPGQEELTAHGAAYDVAARGALQSRQLQWLESAVVSPVGAIDELVDDDESGADDPYDHTLRTGTMLWSWEALGGPFGRTFVRPFRRMCVTASSDARRSARSTRRTRPCVRRSTRSTRAKRRSAKKNAGRWRTRPPRHTVRRSASRTRMTQEVVCMAACYDMKSLVWGQRLSGTMGSSNMMASQRPRRGSQESHTVGGLQFGVY